MARVAIVGGIGYLGYNVAAYHAARGDEVAVVARRASVEKRKRLTRDLEELGVKLATAESLEPGLRLLEKAGGCPDLLYIVVGRLKGSREQLFEANARLPGAWAGFAAKHCRDVVIVYSSSLLAVGDPSPCARDGVVYEEEPHLSGCRPVSPQGASKAEGERLVLSACGEGARVLVERLGLLVGRWSYHPEWRLLVLLARARLRLAAGPWVSLTPAVDYARAALRFMESGERCSWIYAAPYRLRLGELHRLLASALGVRHTLPLPIPAAVPGAIAPALVRELAAASRYRFASRRGFMEGFRWTPLYEAVRELAEWWRARAG